MRVDVRLNDSDLRAGIDALKSKFPYALKRAVMRAANSGRVEMSRQIADDTGLAVRRIRDAIKLEALGEAGASLAVTGTRLPLIEFRATGPEPSRGRGRGVGYRLPGGQGRAPNAFIATMGTGHRGVFRRLADAARLPIAELFGPSLVRVFQRFLPAGEARAREALTTNVRHEISRALSRR